MFFHLKLCFHGQPNSKKKKKKKNNKKNKTKKTNKKKQQQKNNNKLTNILFKQLLSLQYKCSWAGNKKRKITSYQNQDFQQYKKEDLKSMNKNFYA